MVLRYILDRHIGNPKTLNFNKFDITRKTGARICRVNIPCIHTYRTYGYRQPQICRCLQCIICLVVFSVLLYKIIPYTFIRRFAKRTFARDTARTIHAKYNNIIYARDMSPSASIYIYIYIINHPNRSHAVEKR